MLSNVPAICPSLPQHTADQNFLLSCRLTVALKKIVEQLPSALATAVSSCRVPTTANRWMDRGIAGQMFPPGLNLM